MVRKYKLNRSIELLSEHKNCKGIPTFVPPHITTVTLDTLRAKVDKIYERKEQVTENKNTQSKAQTSFIPNPQEEAAMASTFLQSSLPITISENDSTSRGVILVKNHLRANMIIHLHLF